MTESGGLVSFVPNEMLKLSPDCVGPPLPTIEVRIEGEDGTPVGEGEEGTICVRSPIVMTEYWCNPEANQAALLPGRWLRTEDFGGMQDGVLYLSSRLRDLIIRGGENVFPIEVESCLEGHPAVVEAAVFGCDDEDLGQVVDAAVVREPDLSTKTAELQSYCEERLAYFNVPVDIEIRSQPLPRNAAGKVL